MNSLLSSNPCAIIPTMYIGIDIGGTNIRIANSETIDEPKLIHKLNFPNTQDYAQNEQRVITAIQQLAPSLDGIGISIMGRLDESKGIILSASAAPQWVGKPFAATLRKAFSCQVALKGDQYCAALSEATTLGSHDDFTCIVWGTGIGAAIVEYQNDKPLVRTIAYDKHVQYLRPWQLDCGGKWVKENYGKPLEELSETEWAVVMNHFYDHLLTFIEELKQSRLVFGGGVALRQWPRFQVVFNRLRQEKTDLYDYVISLAYYGEDAELVGSLELLR